MSEKQYLPKGKTAKKNAKLLRKNMTAEERHLWYDYLKDCPYTFHRQYVALDYILDFFCPSARLGVELDGSQHYEPEKMLDDARRTAELNTYGIEVLRYTNADIKHRFNSVCEDIYNRTKSRMNTIK